MKKQEGWVEGASWMNWEEKGRRVGGTRDWGKQVEWGEEARGMVSGSKKDGLRE